MFSHRYVLPATACRRFTVSALTGVADREPRGPEGEGAVRGSPASLESRAGIGQAGPNTLISDSGAGGRDLPQIRVQRTAWFAVWSGDESAGVAEEV